MFTLPDSRIARPEPSASTLKLLVFWCALCVGSAVLADTSALPSTESRITQVKVYPGSATVERTTRVAAGARSATFSCLPATLDVRSLQVLADASVRVGEISTLIAPRTLSPGCSTSALDGRIRELEDQKAGLQAEHDALDLVNGYLKGFSGSSGPTSDISTSRPGTDARGMTAVADALRRTGQDALQKQYLLKRRQTELDLQLNPLLAERTRAQGNGDQVMAVTVTLAAPQPTEVRLSYRINGPGWTPSYRALLDTATRRLRIERQALVAQATGEDWRGVTLLLSTGQPQQATSGRLPTPWRIGIEPPPAAPAAPAPRLGFSAAPAAAPLAPSAAMSPLRGGPAQEPLFDVSVFENSFATEFAIPNAIDVPSGGQRATVALGQHEAIARLAVRSSPQLGTSAYLIAELPAPEGVWPAGALQLYRDGAFVGNAQWALTGDAQLTLSFGRDELVRVQAEPERDNQGTTGFAGTRAERSVQRAYVIENRHRTPIAVQILEAAPVSVDEQVRITARFTPEPAELAWNKQPGMAQWRFDLPAGQTARVAADYTIGYPKDARLEMR